jgi:uncharacterized RDD family membrane protein YckC
MSSGTAAAVRPSTADRAADAPYAGLVTRALAFAVDAAVIDGAALLVVAVVALASTVLFIPDDVKTVLLAIGAGAYIVWAAGYFVSFWATGGRTLGNRVMYIRVAPAGGGKLGYRRAVLRFVGLVLAVLPLLLGLVPILFNDRRRGLQDRVADTVVVHDPDRRPPRPGGARHTPAPRQLR